jgi:hypothetical protein
LDQQIYVVTIFDVFSRHKKSITENVCV